jgi:DMSO reductase anchor subunit
MLQTLPLVLFIIMAEVSIGAVAVLVFLDWRNEVKRGFLISYALIYLVLIGLTYLVEQNFATPALLSTFTQLDKTWTAYQSLPLLLFFLLMIPYNLLLWFDRSAGVDGRGRIEAAKAEVEPGDTQSTRPARRSTLRALRLASGAATVLAGLVTLFVMAMIYRPLASANLGGAFTVVSFFAAAFALGGVLTAMWLGHWYLVTPALSGKPLQFATTLVLAAIFVQIICALSAGPSTAYANKPVAPTSGPTSISAAAHSTPVPGTQVQTRPGNVPVVAPLGVDTIGWLRILIGFALPLVLGALAWKLIRDRSFQSATGMLYLVVVCTLAGEILARGLFLSGL